MQDLKVFDTRTLSDVIKLYSVSKIANYQSMEHDSVEVWCDLGKKFLDLTSIENLI